jgi:hypothetical protein
MALGDSLGLSLGERLGTELGGDIEQKEMNVTAPVTLLSPMSGTSITSISSSHSKNTLIVVS